MVEERESITSKLCSFARAWHTYHTRDIIFDDYLAFDMMGKEEYENMYELIKEGLNGDGRLSREDTEKVIDEYFAPIPLSRIHFCESRLAEFAEGKDKIQYVICGAGGDTFAFRNANDNIEIFEVDHPDTQRYKLERIRKLGWLMRPNVHFVSVDFEKEKMRERLIESGFDPKVPAFFSILGVTYYLSLDNLKEVLGQIASLSGAYNEVVFDYPFKSHGFPERVKRLEMITESLGEVMCGGFRSDEIRCVLCGLGYRINIFLPPEEIQSLYFEGREDNLRAFENVSLVSAYFAGYGSIKEKDDINTMTQAE